ncbi:hypothetical protein TREMEDRAFT_30003, partial [Tremella mesenterica DSM 1558]|uniref:uncharacterized protein n=1 Tax=Tremella mesenterica (strain ATCC 24925 / CBS 8224 / DSM 1558 / NBRC 9311 / NRRL Y-6157 / RJB 2259-6 / UBC 559-6) TaxID=578456 RepID=UPI0003F4A40D
QFANAPPQVLSNYEVLQHSLSLRNENLQLQKRILTGGLRQQHEMRKVYPVKLDKEKEELEELPSDGDERLEDEAERRGISDDLVWVQDELIKYLCSPYNSTSRQTAQGVIQLADQLQDYQLTKAEILQICNLASTTAVELYAVIDDPDTRYHPDPEPALDSIAQTVSSTLLSSPSKELNEFLQPVSLPQIHTDSKLDVLVSGVSGISGQVGKGEDQEYVHEAEWGPDREDAVDDEMDEGND